MNPSISDRILSIISYYTFGIFSIIWIVFANVTKKRISPFLYYNLFQSIIISVVLAFISLIYDIAINFMSTIPLIGNIARAFEQFFNKTPIFFTFTLSGFIVTIIISLLAIMCLFGKKPQIPLISNIVQSGFNG